MVLDHLPHLARPVRIRRDPRHQGPVPPRDLLPVRQVPRPRDVACVDRVADHDVQAVLGGGRPEAPFPSAKIVCLVGKVGWARWGCSGHALNSHGVPRVDIAQRAPRRQQHVLLDAQLAQPAQVAAVPREVRVRVAQPTHQRAAAAVEDAHARVGAQGVYVGYAAHGGDA